MKILIIVLTFCSINCFGQSEESAVKAAINQFFEGMRKSDSLLLKGVISPTAVFQTIVEKEGGERVVRTEEIPAFITAVTRPHPDIYDERITYDVVKIDGALAFAWTPYKFYVGEKFSHCGVNAFHLVKLGGSWKIQYIIDTRRKKDCP